MKAIKTIIVLLAVIAVIIEGAFLGTKAFLNSELTAVRTNHTSYGCDVSQNERGYFYKLDDMVCSEAEYIEYLEKEFRDMDTLLTLQGIAAALFIIAAVAAGRSVRKREEVSELTLC